MVDEEGRQEGSRTEGSDIENPEEIIDDIVSTYDEIQSEFGEAATIAGEEKERFEAIRPAWDELGRSATTDPDKAQVYASGVSTLSAFRDELKAIRPELRGITTVFRGVVMSSDSTASTTSTSVVSISSGSLSLPDEVTLPRHSRFEETRQRLGELDVSLAATYASTREALYATHADPERVALFQTRQAFDHFFSLLAPDDQVRASPHWSPKADPDPEDQVTRFERVMYAANTHIKIEAKRKTLIASAKHLIDVYSLMNKAHARGELDPGQSREALKEMHSLLENWVWAITLPLSFQE